MNIKSMNPEEKTLSHIESLNIISDIISRTKENYRESSFYFLLWGWLITFASFGFFLLQQYTAFKYYFIPFPVAAAVGITATIIYYSKKREAAETYLDHYVSRLWMVLGLSFMTVVFINVVQGRSPFTYTLVIAGIGTMVSGLVMNFRPMIWGGILFFAAAVATIFVPENYKVLLHGLAIIPGYLVPGYLLKSSRN